MCKGSNTSTTQTTAPNPTAMQAYQDLMSRAAGVAATPYTPYGGELTAGLTPQQNLGIANINQYAGWGVPYVQQATGLALDAARPISAQDIQQYMDPFTQNVVDASKAQFADMNARQLQQVRGNAIAQGAFGGDREAVAEAETARQQALAQDPIIANLLTQGYTTGLNTALTEQQARQQGAYSLGNLGVAGENAGLTGANAQIGAGTLQQQTQQALDNARYAQFMQAMGYPFQTTQWLAGIDSGVGSQMGGTSTTTPPPPNPLSQWLGAGLTGAGLFAAPAGGTSAAAGLGAALSGVGSTIASALPAALAFLASGGAVSEGLVRNPTIPESHETLLAQQRQLVAGHRRVQMFPRGSQELPLPRGMRRLVVDGDVFHYDPEAFDAAQVRHLAGLGRENEMLDLGPYSKDEVMHRIERGERPVAVVERDPHGIEVRAAAGTHLTAHHQLAAMRRRASPGHSVRVEDPLHTLGHRLGRATGGAVPHFDVGGGVPGLVMDGMPYAGAPGWVPMGQIARGAGAPRAPQAPSAAGPSLTQQANQVGALTRALTGNRQPLGIAPSWATEGGPMTVSPGLVPFSPTGLAGSEGAIYRRGGRVRGYDDGGVVTDPAFDFDDRFNAVYGEPAAGVVPVQTSTVRPQYEKNVGGIFGGLDYKPVGWGDGTTANALPSPAALSYDEPEPARGLVRQTAAPDYDEETIPTNARPALYSVPGYEGLVAPRPPSNNIGPALMTAGLALMANRSPYLGVALGEAGLAGVGSYNAAQKLEKEQELKEAQVNLAVKRLAQQADLAHERIALQSRPYSEMTAYQKANLESLKEWRNRGSFKPTGLMTEEGHPVVNDQWRPGVAIDSITGDPVDPATKLVPFQPAGRPGGIQTLAQALVNDRENQRKTNPGLPPLSLEEATVLAHRAPNDQNTLRRLSLAQGYWKAWRADPNNFGNETAPESKPEYWEKRFGVSATPGGTPTAAPAAAPPSAGAPKPAAPARPPSVPPGAGYSPSRHQWFTRDGHVFDEGGNPVQ
jgi:hypothetical protein